MSIIEKKRSEIADSLKMIVPDCWRQTQDPPMASECLMEQHPKGDSEPIISVGIMECDELTFAFDMPFVSPQLPDSHFEGTYRVSAVDGFIVFDGAQYATLSFLPEYVQSATDQTNSFTLYDVCIGKHFHWQKTERQRFKGALRLLVDNGKIVVINDITVENYLYSVISSEMNAHAPIELLKAHAIISRSWLLKPIIEKTVSTSAVCERVTDDEIIRWYERDSHTLFDVCADDHCQRYQGIGRATTASVAAAIDATRGMVLTYGDKICDARFSKACGGATELFENCWADTHMPYLESVVDSDSAGVDDLTVEANADRWIRSAPAAWCNTSDADILQSVLNDYDRSTHDFYRWREEYTTDYLSDLVQRKSGIDFGAILDLQPVRRGSSGRIVRLRVVGTKRTMIVGKELEIRRWLSESHLYSSAFVVDKTPEGFRLTGAGWGHGVGLCQIGAAVMAAHGKTYDQILTHYFNDATIHSLY